MIFLNGEKMKTYLLVWFNSNGLQPSKVIQSLTSMGFNPIKGRYDFEYDWPNRPSMDELYAFIDKVQQTLKGTNAFFKVETV